VQLPSLPQLEQRRYASSARSKTSDSCCSALLFARGFGILRIVDALLLMRQLCGGAGAFPFIQTFGFSNSSTASRGIDRRAPNLTLRSIPSAAIATRSRNRAVPGRGSAVLGRVAGSFGPSPSTADACAPAGPPARGQAEAALHGRQHSRPALLGPPTPALLDQTLNVTRTNQSNARRSPNCWQQALVNQLSNPRRTQRRGKQ